MGKLLPDGYDSEVIPQVAELDELQIYVKKTHKIWLGTAVGHFRSRILGWVSGDHSSETFEPLWDNVSARNAIFKSRINGQFILCLFLIETKSSARLI